MTCQVYGCLSRHGVGKSLYKFPDPVHRQSVYLTWIQNLHIDPTTYKNSKNKLVCEDHFQPSCFNSDGNLVVNIFFSNIFTNIYDLDNN